MSAVFSCQTSLFGPMFFFAKVRKTRSRGIQSWLTSFFLIAAAIGLADVVAVGANVVAPVLVARVLCSMGVYLLSSGF